MIETDDYDNARNADADLYMIEARLPDIIKMESIHDQTSYCTNNDNDWFFGELTIAD